jgi:hypothetical protein
MHFQMNAFKSTRLIYWCLPVLLYADIMPGQGLYFNTLTNTWRAKNCESNSYGMSNKTYGLSPAACRDCPTGQVATTAAGYPTSASFFVDNGDGTKGFISVKACVNQPGVCGACFDIFLVVKVRISK